MTNAYNELQFHALEAEEDNINEKIKLKKGIEIFHQLIAERENNFAALNKLYQQSQEELKDVLTNVGVEDLNLQKEVTREKHLVYNLKKCFKKYEEKGK